MNLIRLRLWLGVLVLANSGCAVTTVDGERLAIGSEAYRAYAERVFREQNRVATELAFALEADGIVPERTRRLTEAETRLLEACAELNAVAAARRDDRDLGPLRSARAARSGPDCEAAVREAVRVLERGGDDA